MARAVPKRRNEFAKARECARDALARMGIRDFALLTGAQREPLWPAGVIGSITHCPTLCAVAVASAQSYQGVGIDVEPALPIEREVAEVVANSRDSASLSGVDQLLAARMVFSAKESFYKAQFRLTRRFLDFADVAVELRPDGKFYAELLAEAAPLHRGELFGGGWQLQDDLLLTALFIPRKPEVT